MTVTALQPGATDTEFFDAADMRHTRVAEGQKDDPAEVARLGFEAMMEGQVRVIAASRTRTREGVAPGKRP